MPVSFLWGDKSFPATAQQGSHGSPWPALRHAVTPTARELQGNLVPARWGSPGRFRQLGLRAPICSVPEPTPSEYRPQITSP